MKKILIVPVTGFLLLVGLTAQNRAVMESPIIKGGADTISFVARFSQLNPEKVYRIGVGTSSGPLRGATFELESDAGAVRGEVVDFVQGYTSSWWDVPEVNARGYVLEGAAVASSAGLMLRFSIPRTEADKLKKLYVFVAKKYGPDRWYVEDGSELSDEYW